MDQQPAPSQHGFPLIDILRAFAALSVVVYHVVVINNWTNFPVSGPLVWFRIGFFGVDIFFVISGFVIAYSGISLYNREKNGFYLKYIFRRVMRIAPLFYFTAVVYIFTISPDILFAGDITKHLVTHLLFIHNLWPDTYGSIDGVNWSVGVEMQFYALMIVLIPFLSSSHSVLRLATILAVGISIAWIWRFCSFLLLHGSGPEGMQQLLTSATSLPASLDYFSIGAVLAIVMRSYPPARISGKWLVLVACLTMCSGYFSWTIFWHNAQYWNNVAMVSFFRTMVAATCAGVIYLLCVPVNKFVLMVVSPAIYLGKISYGIYLWHRIVLAAAVRIQGIDHTQIFWITLIGTLILSSLSYHFFEARLSDMAKDWNGNRILIVLNPLKNKIFTIRRRDKEQIRPIGSAETR